MRWASGGDPPDAEEYGHQDVVSWAEDRPILAVCLVLVAWVVVVFAIGSVYGMFV
jgi:hypothetical protein